jgi:hypothetical protein
MLPPLSSMQMPGARTWVSRLSMVTATVPLLVVSLQTLSRQ